MDWHGRRVLVTGAGGFIGSHLAERLLAEGADVVCFVRYNSRRDPGLLRLLPRESMDRVNLVFGDLRDPDAVRRAGVGAEIVFHLGALISIPYSYIHPREVVEANILGTLNVLEAARDNRPARVIHTSTSEVFGTARYVPIDEKHELQGQSPYSASKIGADHIAESYWRAFDVPVTTIRPFNTYGPRQSARAVIPAIVSQALAGRDIRLGSLNPTRDFTFVSDTVEAFLLAASAEPAAVLGEEINLGTGKEISIGDLVELIGRLIGKDLDVSVEDERLRPRLSEVERLLADNSKALRLLGWSPTIDLETGLRATIEWIGEHPDFYQPEVYQT
jgi:NAD dependent epimerase/dehydratase